MTPQEKVKAVYKMLKQRREQILDTVVTNHGNKKQYSELAEDILGIIMTMNKYEVKHTSYDKIWSLVCNDALHGGGDMAHCLLRHFVREAEILTNEPKDIKPASINARNFRKRQHSKNVGKGIKSQRTLGEVNEDEPSYTSEQDAQVPISAFLGR